MVGSSEADREAEIARRILDGEINDVRLIDGGTSVNRDHMREMMKNSTTKPTASEAEAEMMRKIMNGEM